MKKLKKVELIFAVLLIVTILVSASFFLGSQLLVAFYVLLVLLSGMFFRLHLQRISHGQVELINGEVYFLLYLDDKRAILMRGSDCRIDSFFHVEFENEPKNFQYLVARKRQDKVTLELLD